MEDIEVTALSQDEMEELCKVAEKSARKHVLSKLPSSKISVLDVTVDVEGTKPTVVNVNVEICLSSQVKGYDVQELANESLKKAFFAVEEDLRKFACRSTK